MTHDVYSKVGLRGRDGRDGWRGGWVVPMKTTNIKSKLTLCMTTPCNNRIILFNACMYVCVCVLIDCINITWRYNYFIYK